MSNEDQRIHRNCRMFVLLMFVAVVFAFLLVVGMFYGSVAGQPFSTGAPALRR